MGATCSSEISVDFQRTTRHYIPEDLTLNNHCYENLTFYINTLFMGLNEWGKERDQSWAHGKKGTKTALIRYTLIYRHRWRMEQWERTDLSRDPFFFSGGKWNFVKNKKMDKTSLFHGHRKILSQEGNLNWLWEWENKRPFSGHERMGSGMWGNSPLVFLQGLGRGLSFRRK
jgi:hypothetical protein